jgi:hypothetical protein
MILPAPQHGYGGGLLVDGGWCIWSPLFCHKKIYVFIPPASSSNGHSAAALSSHTGICQSFYLRARRLVLFNL